MPAPQQKKLVEQDETPNQDATVAIPTAKVKNARLRLMKERNENYLADKRDEDEAAEELTKELR